MIELRPGSELGDYRLDEPLGHGGMGAVFRARQRSLHRTVAIKIIRPDLTLDDELRERFVREARVAAAIEHPNVIPIYDVGSIEGLLFIAMRFVSGPTLADVLSREGPLRPERAVAILVQVANALQAAHDIGLIHRDVKPNNILLADHGAGDHVYLADFGLARFVAQTGLTRTGAAMGTPHYMAPEQVLGQKVDSRTDIYALGCVVHQALTGTVPFPRDDSGAIFYAQLHADPPIPSATNPSLGTAYDEIISRSLAKDATDRFPTTRDVASALQAAVSAPAGVSSRPSGVPDAEWPRRITRAYIESRVPEMKRSELAAFVAELRRRNWTDDDIAERVYPYVPRTASPRRDDDLPAAVVLIGSVGADSRTRELLYVLPGGRDIALTPTELAGLMKPDAQGQRLSKASVRAVIRNLRRVENRLLLEERISRRVLSVDWERYDIDNAGRYYVDPLDREELDKHVQGVKDGPVPSLAASDPDVLVWQRNPRPAIYHSGPECPTLGRSVSPGRQVRFAGPGTVGWLPVSEARQIPGARACRNCM